jgi:hypothetical protein
MTFVSLPLSPGAVEAGLVLFCLFMTCGILYGCVGCVWITARCCWPDKFAKKDDEVALVERRVDSASKV